jgi:hypothetical protein
MSFFKGFAVIGWIQLAGSPFAVLHDVVGWCQLFVAINRALKRGGK